MVAGGRKRLEMIMLLMTATLAGPDEAGPDET